jgi:hypothetical protein
VGPKIQRDTHEPAFACELMMGRLVYNCILGSRLDIAYASQRHLIEITGLEPSQSVPWVFVPCASTITVMLVAVLELSARHWHTEYMFN